MFSLLLVEDDDDFMAVLQRRFERRGMQVNGCTTYEAALLAMEKQSFAVAIVDGNLHGLSGIGLARQLRQLDSDVQIIMLSGRVDSEFEAAAREAGVCEYLGKPCSLADLEAVVRRLAGLPESSTCFLA